MREGDRNTALNWARRPGCEPSPRFLPFREEGTLYERGKVGIAGGDPLGGFEDFGFTVDGRGVRCAKGVQT